MHLQVTLGILPQLLIWSDDLDQGHEEDDHYDFFDTNLFP